MNMGLWHITNSNSGCRDYLVTELLPPEFSPGAVSLRDPAVAVLWLRTLWEFLCYCTFGFSGLGSLMWAINVTFPHCSKEISSVLGKNSNSNFPFSAFRAAIPWWVLRPEQHHHGLCSQSKSICSERSYWHATFIIWTYQYGMETPDCRQLFRAWIRYSLQVKRKCTSQDLNSQSWIPFL